MRQLTTAAQAAKMIRQELKKAFPSIKFRVTSENYSMGDSVNIHWNDGATTEQVEAITAKYQYGSFDGMTDSYDYTNKRADIPQAKYVMEHRHISDEMHKRVEEYLTKTFNSISEPVDRMVWRYIRNIDLTNGLTDQMIHDAIFN